MTTATSTTASSNISADGWRPSATVLLVGLLTLAVAVGGLVGVTGSAAADEPVVIYDDGLAADYQDWSWATVDLAGRDEVHTGSTSIAADFGPWEGLYLARPVSIALAGGAAIEFWMHGGGGPAGPIQVVVVDGSHNGGSPVEIQATPGVWTRHQIPLDPGGSPGSSSPQADFGGLWWQNATNQARSTIYIDDVTLVGLPDAPPSSADGSSADGPALTVDLGQRSMVRTITNPADGAVTNQTLSFPHEISDGVYGLNFAAPGLLDEVSPGVNRWGGNAVERYNFRNGTTNLGKDWFFMNKPGGQDDDDQFEANNQRAGVETLLTVPAIGWVASDISASCGYPVNQFGSMEQSETHWLDANLQCGNGRQNGDLLASEPGLTSVQAGSENTTAWVSDLVATHGSAAQGGVETYAIGNEPGLWHETHSDVVAQPVSRQQIIDTTIDHAQAVKSADPTAAVAGPVLWGGYSYYITSEELAAGRRPGDVPTFVGDYLQAMSQAESDSGRRLLDTLAINFYDDRVYYGGSDALRLESTRSLWDPTYAPQDWWVVRDFVGEGSAVIPRMQSLIDNNYPGTGLAITEYNFGGLDTVAGGLTQADALGIFGREGIDQAILWDPYSEELSSPESQFANTPAMWAYRMYRNYDGRGGRFGDQALFAESDDQDTLSVYAARRSSDDAVTIMVINKATSTQVSDLTVGLNGSAQVYQYGSGDSGSISQLDELALAGSATVTYPPRSITLLVVDGERQQPEPPVDEQPPESTTSTTVLVVEPPVIEPPDPEPPTPPQEPESEGNEFFEDFASDDSMDRFETGIFHRDDFVVSATSWLGDHESTGPGDMCGLPENKRTIERGERSQGFNDDWIYRCSPGGDAVKAHVMTSIGDTSGYSIGGFAPTQTFTGVTEVRWAINITDLGGRQFPEVKIIPAENFDFQNLPCAIEWLPCDTDGHDVLDSVGTSFFNHEPAINAYGARTSGPSWNAGWRSTANDPALDSIRTRRQHFFRDNGDGTMTFGIERADGGFETVSAPGSFPDGEVRVVFADHNYTPTKDEPPDITFTWHWDDVAVTAEAQ